MSAIGIPENPDRAIPPGQVVIVVGWLVTVAMIVTTGTRLATKLSLKRLLTVDDSLAVVATILGSIQMGFTHKAARIAVENSTMVGEEWDNFQTALYISQLLYLPTVCLAKLSVLYSLHLITPVPEHKTPLVISVAFTGLLYLAFQFTAAFQCAEIYWNILSGKCFNQTPFWQSWGALDITTDTFIVSFPVFIVATLQMALGFKIVVAGIFGSRIITIVASACRIVYVTRCGGKVTPGSFDFWAYILTTELEQCFSVITACIPFLKPVFESLETGMLAPSHGITSMMGSAGSGNRSKRSQQTSGQSFTLGTIPSHGINVSRRISTHSDECGLVKEGATSWVEPLPPSSNIHVR